MRARSNVQVLFAAAVLIGSLALYRLPQAAGSDRGPPRARGPRGRHRPGAPAAPRPGPQPPRVVEAPVVAPAPAPVEAPAPPPPPPAPAAAVPAPSPFKDVFFNYDKAGIRDDQKAALNDNVGWLKVNTGAKLLVEGHCDSRGTAEYNLALGERRAKAVKDYLVGAGIAADRISTISYGKERPFVLGQDESAWKWNRRGHFVLQGQ